MLLISIYKAIESVIIQSKISIYLLTHIEREYCHPTYAVATLHVSYSSYLELASFDIMKPHAWGYLSGLSMLTVVHVNVFS